MLAVQLLRNKKPKATAEFVEVQNAIAASRRGTQARTEFGGEGRGRGHHGEALRCQHPALYSALIRGRFSSSRSLAIFAAILAQKEKPRSGEPGLHFLEGTWRAGAGVAPSVFSFDTNLTRAIQRRSAELRNFFAVSFGNSETAFHRRPSPLSKIRHTPTRLSRDPPP